VAGLRVAARLAENEGWGGSRALRGALAKLETALVPEERERGRRLARRLGTPRTPPAEAKKLAVLERAVRENRAVDLTYFTDWSEAVSSRTVRPYAVIAAPGGRYLVGHDSNRDAILTFRIDHVLRLRATAERFTPPADFDAARYVDWKAPGNPKQVQAVLRFDSEAAAEALDQFPGARPGPAGSRIVRLAVWPGAAFCRFVLSWAGACEVLEPTVLRQEVRDYARQVAASHGA